MQNKKRKETVLMGAKKEKSDAMKETGFVSFRV